MSNHDEGVSRRGFLKAAVLTTAAAAATGAGAAKLAPEIFAGKAAAPAPILPNTPTAPAAAAIVNGGSETLSQLAAAQAENIRLQAELDGALRRLAAAEQGQPPNAQTETLQQELGAASGQISVLTGLLALYDQLEAVDWEGTVESGLNTLSGAFGDLLSDLPSLNDGVQLGELRLAEFEAHVPLLENGRAWLENHLFTLDDHYRAFEQMLQTAVERVGPVLQMLQEWFDAILKWLPFGMGSTAVLVMQTITSLMQETPATIQGTRTNVAQPLDAWLLKDPGEQESHIAKKLFKPLREQALQPAAQTAAKVETTKTLFDEQVAQSLNAAVANRRQLRQAIEAYRQQHQV